MIWLALAAGIYVVLSLGVGCFAAAVLFWIGDPFGQDVARTRRQKIKAWFNHAIQI